MLQVIAAIWVIGGTILFIAGLLNDNKTNNTALNDICDKNRIPHILGELCSYFICITIGFPFFVYRMISLFIKGDVTNAGEGTGD